VISERVVRVGMPQMALGCLSENWLLKELGDLHWDNLCASLRCKSKEIADSRGRRLYATFVRVRLNLNDTLIAFSEGDELRLGIEMSRFGRSSVQSTIALDGDASSGTATLLTTFSFREERNNTSLVKSEPAAEFGASITPVVEASPFFTEYSEIRRRYGRLHHDEPGTGVYPINPFTDSNGANLLYFASYQSIHDYLSSPPGFHTKSRDIYYFRNSELSDKIHRVAVAEPLRAEERLELNDILFRASDGESIAFISTVKECG
jgi:probable biosynthetic protein (TIGR04098 family)